jgi:hypothetical protein
MAGGGGGKLMKSSSSSSSSSSSKSPPNSTHVLCFSLSLPTYNILAVSVAFMVLFCSYNTLQNYATSTFPPGLGNQSLAVLYVACAISVFAAPGMTNQLGARLTMFIGAALYVVYMASAIHIIPQVVLAMSVVIGFGGAILWIAMGVFVTQNSTKETYGQNMGIFWSIFQLNSILGNLGAYFIFSGLNDLTWLFVSFTIIGTVGTLMLLALRKPEEAKKDGEEEDEEGGVSVNDNNHSATAATAAAPSKPTLRERLASFWSDLVFAFKLMFTRNMVLLMPMYFFSGLELSVSCAKREKNM